MAWYEKRYFELMNKKDLTNKEGFEMHRLFFYVSDLSLFEEYGTFIFPNDLKKVVVE